MKKYHLSIAALAIGIISWFVKLILESPLILYLNETKILLPVLYLFATYNFISGLVTVCGIILAVLGFRNNRNIVLLVSGVIVNFTYLITYVKMIHLIMQQ